MGSPNSTSANHDPLYELLIHGNRPSMDELRTRGIDTKQLEDKFEQLKPKLKYFGMFKPLREHFAQPHKASALDSLADDVLGMRECIRLPLSRHFRGSGGDAIFEYQIRDSYPFYARLSLFLTKKGLWTIHEERGARGGPQSAFLTFEVVGDMAAYVDVFLKEFAADWQYETYSAAHTVSLSLDELVDRWITERSSQMDSMKQLRQSMEKMNQTTYGPTRF